jgi:PAS domain S-box-containing protein
MAQRGRACAPCWVPPVTPAPPHPTTGDAAPFQPQAVPGGAGPVGGDFDVSAVLERVQDGFVALDRTWHYRYLNSTAARLLGRSKPADLIGKHIWTEYPEGVGQEFQLAYQRAMDTQQVQVFLDYYPPWQRWFENRVFPSSDGLTIYFTDVTQRVKDSEALRQSEQRLRAFFDSGLVGMAMFTADWRWGQVNDRLCEMLGYSREQMLSLEWGNLQAGDDGVRDRARMSEALGGAAGSFRMERRLRRADGSVLEAAVVGCPERATDGSLDRIFCLIEDIGQRKSDEAAQLHQRQALEQLVIERTQALAAARDIAETANRAKSHFLAHMSHELRTPLNAILGFSQLLGLPGAASDETRKRYAAAIHEAGGHLLALINEVLDLASIEAGKAELKIDAVDLSAVLSDAVTMLTPLAAAKQIRLQSDLLAGPMVQADRQRLRQVLINLLSNAIKYNRAGAEVHITSNVSGARVKVLVSDNGAGIQADSLDKLFQPFSRLAGGEVEGTGMGLEITRQLVELMSGQVGVFNQAQGGACFWFELPQAT